MAFSTPVGHALALLLVDQLLPGMERQVSARL